MNSTERIIKSVSSRLDTLFEVYELKMRLDSVNSRIEVIINTREHLIASGTIKIGLLKELQELNEESRELTKKIKG